MASPRLAISFKSIYSRSWSGADHVAGRQRATPEHRKGTVRIDAARRPAFPSDACHCSDIHPSQVGLGGSLGIYRAPPKWGLLGRESIETHSGAFPVLRGA